MQLPFIKWQGCGNDFILFHEEIEKVKDLNTFAQKVCDRHYGIGADGILILRPSDKADIKMDILNADGTYAQMCGNGIRCLAKYAYEEKIVKNTTLSVETGAGILPIKLTLGNAHQVENICVDMGKPILEGDKIPVIGYGSERIIAKKLVIDGKAYEITCVSMGNPHCVIFVPDVENICLDKIGPLIEKNELFPEKTNVEFAQIISKEVVRMRVWERGAGITKACGTGAAATITAGVLNALTPKKIKIILDGGELLLEWKDDEHIYMTGPSERVFQGIIEW